MSSTSSRSKTSRPPVPAVQHSQDFVVQTLYAGRDAVDTGIAHRRELLVRAIQDRHQG
jgi:hypothetical protein